jgi:hypothetical protein
MAAPKLKPVTTATSDHMAKTLIIRMPIFVPPQAYLEAALGMAQQEPNRWPNRISLNYRIPGK